MVRRARQSGRTPWRAVSLRGERKALMAAKPFVPEAGEDERLLKTRQCCYGQGTAGYKYSKKI